MNNGHKNNSNTKIEAGVINACDAKLTVVGNGKFIIRDESFKELVSDDESVQTNKIGIQYFIGKAYCIRNKMMIPMIFRSLNFIETTVVNHGDEEWEGLYLPLYQNHRDYLLSVVKDVDGDNVSLYTNAAALELPVPMLYSSFVTNDVNGYTALADKDFVIEVLSKL